MPAGTLPGTKIENSRFLALLGMTGGGMKEHGRAPSDEGVCGGPDYPSAMPVSRHHGRPVAKLAAGR